MAEPDNGGVMAANSQDALIQAAEKIAGILSRNHADAVVIGAVALAAYDYIRQTDDIDLGVNADLPTLRNLVDIFRREGFEVNLREPDAHDPLGGVIDIEGPFGMLQVISYADRFPAVIEDALQEATLVVRPGSRLRLVPLPQLVALKLYAGGMKSKADIVELLLHNPDADIEAIRQTCRRYRLTGLDELIAEIQ